MTSTTTLSAALFGHETALKRVLLVLGGSVLIALAAQVSKIEYPVPLTLQTLAVLIVGLTLGARLGAATLITYLAEGAAGLPVFTPSTMPGLAAFSGPTAGFLVGFVLMAWMVGYASDRGWTRNFFGAALAALVASAVLYIPGAAWAALAFGKSLPELLSGWVLPFLAGDAVKAVMAALIVTGAWAALKSRKA